MPAFKLQIGKTKKDKALLFGLVVVIFFCAYFHVLLRPAIGKMTKLLPEVSALRDKVADAEFVISSKAMLEEKKAEFAEKMSAYAEILPDEKEVPKLLENLSKIAGESGVKIIGIKPVGTDMPEEEGGNIYNEIPIEIVARSGYHQLGEFLQKLEMGKRFILVKDLDIKANPKSINRHDVKLIACTYTLVKK